MTDIVERLRAEIVLLEATGAEAADEIDRLRHDLTLARLDRDHARAERDAARREGIEAAAAIAAKFRSAIQNEADHASTFQMEGALCAAISAIDEAEVAIRALLTEGEQ